MNTRARLAPLACTLVMSSSFRPRQTWRLIHRATVSVRYPGGSVPTPVKSRFGNDRASLCALAARPDPGTTVCNGTFLK